MMNYIRENPGKSLLITVSVFLWLVIGVLFAAYGYNKTWHLWNLDTQKLPFMDFRLIPGSAESFAKGFEPSVENPYDPNHRIFNYPAFWRLFFYTGITQADTVWISVSMIVLFFISVFLFPEKLSVPGATAMLLVLFSPASMLLYERANVDLIVFVICVMIVLAESRSAYLATLLIMFGSIVKLFPFFGVTVLWKEARNKFLLLFTACSLVLVTYMLATWSSVKASWTLTMRGDGSSYGTDIFVTRYGAAITKAFSHWLPPEPLALLIKYGSLMVALVLITVIVIRALLKSGQPDVFTERNLAAFRMGASIYVGTFLLGNNWDYRLAFLVLVVPQIMEWIGSTQKAYRIASWMSLILILLSCWHFWINVIPMEFIFHSVNDSRKFWFILDEIFNWLLFGSLSYLLFASAPKWIKELPESFLSKPTIFQRNDDEKNRPTAS